jgi:cytochrome P450
MSSDRIPPTSSVTSSTCEPPVRVRGQYRFPPGLDHNLIFYAFRKFRPQDPILLFEHLVQTYGPVAHYRIGPEDIVFINDPELIREVLIVQNDNFVKERTVQRSKMLLGDGMITAEGEKHWSQRRIAQPAFHRRRITTYGETMVREALKTRERWSGSTEIDVSQHMMALTLEIVSQTLFGVKLGSEVREIVTAINQIMDLYHFLVVLPAAEMLVNFPIPQMRRFRRARARLDAVVQRILENRLNALGQRDDLLSMMLEGAGVSKVTELTTEIASTLRDQVITMFLAGYETVANAMTWTWYLLSQNPDAEARMHGEIEAVLGGREATVEDVPQLKYVEMVMAESMRLYPPAWAMGRKALNDFELGPYFLPRGTTMLMSQWIAHRNPDYFPHPLRFDPERFRPEAPARPKFSYFPFGAGPRQCIGESFAWMEGVLILATISQRWRLRLVPGHRVKTQPLITLRSKYGMRMTLQLR